MSWVLDGQKITVRYKGQFVTGVVESSRVKYGGKVQYTLALFAPIQLRWRSEPTEHLLVEDDDIIP